MLRVCKNVTAIFKSDLVNGRFVIPYVESYNNLKVFFLSGKIQRSFQVEFFGV